MLLKQGLPGNDTVSLASPRAAKFALGRHLLNLDFSSPSLFENEVNAQ